MKEKVQENNEVMEIDLKRVFQAVWSKAWVVAIVAVVCAVLAFFGTKYFITPQYKSSVMFYVNNNAVSIGNTSLSLSSGDITASKSLVETYIVILNSRACLNDIIDYTGADRTYEELRGMLSAASVNETEVFEVVITSPDPAEAERLANAVAYILPKRISSIVEGTSANVVDYAIRAASPSSPSYPRNTMLGFLIGLVLSVGVIAIREIFDVTIRTEEDIERCCQHPVLAAVPDMLSPSKGGYYSVYDPKKRRNDSRSKGRRSAGEVATVGKNISFAASEAYKLLRTKLQFSFVDEPCPVIGVSSALAGEGKSLTSVNLAYTLAQLDKRVLLIDCDMRRPSLFTKLPIQKTPGLSNYLTGQNGMDIIIQECQPDTEEGFSVIASGRNPPNPIELLSSTKMEKAIERLRESYDYIILDLPPVGEVSDAMVAAKLVDGILLVVRQDYCNTVAFSHAVNQFEFIESRVLGIVMNGVGDGARYGQKYYKKYYSKYGYAAAARSDEASSKRRRH